MPLPAGRQRRVSRRSKTGGPLAATVRIPG